MKSIIIIALISICITTSSAQECKYAKSYYLRMVDKKNDRRAGTIFQILGGIGIAYTAISAADNSRRANENYKPYKSILPASGIFVWGTIIKINAGKVDRRRRK